MGALPEKLLISTGFSTGVENSEPRARPTGKAGESTIPAGWPTTAELTLLLFVRYDLSFFTGCGTQTGSL
jgi:hypothetical protein